jgi:hypothetical protein
MISKVAMADYFCVLYLINDEVKEDEMGRACSANIEEKECV